MRTLALSLAALTLLGCTVSTSPDADGDEHVAHAAGTETSGETSSGAGPGEAARAAAGPRRQVLAPNPSPLPVFSPAVRSGNLIFLSGQIGTRPGTAELVPGGLEAETVQTLDNIESLLGQIGLGMEDVVKCTVMLSDIKDYAGVNEIYQRYFPKDPPARSALAASGLALGATVEIECIAAAR